VRGADDPARNAAHGRWECPTDPEECEVIEARYNSRSGVCIATKLAARPREDIPRLEEKKRKSFFMGKLKGMLDE